MVLTRMRILDAHPGLRHSCPLYDFLMMGVISKFRD